MDRGTFFCFIQNVLRSTLSRFIQNVLRSTLSRFIQNVLRSTLLHANTTTTKCIQFLNKRILVTGILAWLSLQTSPACANVTERCTFDSQFSCHNLASVTVNISGCRFLESIKLLARERPF